jgi:hypothetical protein
MRIAFLVNIFPLASETFVTSQIVGLIERGHTVEIFSRFRNSDDVANPELKKYRLIERTQCLAIPAGRHAVFRIRRLNPAVGLTHCVLPGYDETVAVQGSGRTCG